MSNFWRICILSIGTCLVLMGMHTQPGEAIDKLFIGTADYAIQVGETEEQAEQAALVLARKNAEQQAGAYVVSYSEMKNNSITVDQQRSVASSLAHLLEGTIEKVWMENSGVRQLRIKAQFSIDVETLEQKFKLVQTQLEKETKRAQVDTLLKEGDVARTWADKIVKYRQAAAVDPTYATTQVKLALALYASNPIYYRAYDDGIKHLNKALAIDPNCGDALWHRSRLYLVNTNMYGKWQDFIWDGRSKDVDKAIVDLALLLAKHPTYSAEVGQKLGDLYFIRGYARRDGNFEKAWADYQCAADAFSSSIRVYKEKADWALYKRGWAYANMAILGLDKNKPLEQIKQVREKATKDFLAVKTRSADEWKMKANYSGNSDKDRLFSFDTLNSNYRHSVAEYVYQMVRTHPEDGVQAEDIGDLLPE